MTINWNRRKYTKEEFVLAWYDSISVAQVAQKLGCNKNGSGYYVLRDAAVELKLNNDHMLGRAWSKGKSNANAPKQSLEEILVVDSKYRSTTNLKHRLLKAGLLKNICELCGQLPEWNGLPLVLQLDHINGIRTDNRLKNLRILCGHCHSQTDTFCSKNIAKQAEVVERNTQRTQTPPGLIAHAGSTPVFRTCKDCQKPISKNATRCKSCKAKSQPLKIIWPSNTELLEMLNASNYTQVAKTLGVSDNAIRKRLKK